MVPARSAFSAAPPSVVWALLAQPGHWTRWAPHVRGGGGLADAAGVVREGARGTVRLAGVAPVPVRIVRVDDGRSWQWRVAGVVDMDHVVEPVAGGSSVTVTLRGPQPLQAVLERTYGPLIGVLVRRLARVAADG